MLLRFIYIMYSVAILAQEVCWIFGPALLGIHPLRGRPETAKSESERDGDNFSEPGVESDSNIPVEDSTSGEDLYSKWQGKRNRTSGASSLASAKRLAIAGSYDSSYHQLKVMLDAGLLAGLGIKSLMVTSHGCLELGSDADFNFSPQWVRGFAAVKLDGTYQLIRQLADDANKDVDCTVLRASSLVIVSQSLPCRVVMRSSPAS